MLSQAELETTVGTKQGGTSKDSEDENHKLLHKDVNNAALKRFFLKISLLVNFSWGRDVYFINDRNDEWNCQNKTQDIKN